MAEFRTSDARELIQRYLDDAISESELVELNDALLADADARRAYIKASYQGRLIAENLAEELRERERPAARPAPRAMRFPVAAGLSFAAGLLVCAAAVAIYVFAFADDAATETAPPRATVATLIEATGALMVDDHLATSGGDYAPGDYTIESGSAELMLRSGVAVTLSGRTSLRVHSKMRATLIDGTAEFHCPPGAEGYTVRVPGDVEIVDLGTRFSVSILGDGRTAIRVLEGRVVLNEAKGRALALDAGQRGFAYHGRVYRSLFAAVSASSDHENRIADELLDEDVIAHTDRAYEWNGVDAAGLPEELIGAEFVQTAMEDKSNRELRMDVTLALPATVYLFVSDEADAPDWVAQRGWVDTGWTVGLDNSSPNGKPGVGPGESIDLLYSVYRLDVPAPGTISLGPAGVSVPPLPRVGTYGIAAVPLSDAPDRTSETPRSE